MVVERYFGFGSGSESSREKANLPFRRIKDFMLHNGGLPVCNGCTGIFRNIPIGVLHYKDATVLFAYDEYTHFRLECKDWEYYTEVAIFSNSQDTISQIVEELNENFPDITLFDLIEEGKHPIIRGNQCLHDMRPPPS